MKPLSANKAAQVAHKTKKTILDAIENGDLSATKNQRGHWQIDPAELNRLFPYGVEELVSTPTQKPDDTAIQNHENRIEIERLRAKLEAEQHLRERVEAEVDDLREQRDKWQTQAQTLLLERSQKPHRAPRSGLLGWFGGSGAAKA